MSDLGLSFVLLEHAAGVDPDVLIDAASSYGLRVSYEGTDEAGPARFTVAGGSSPSSLLVMVVDAPYPDAVALPVGLASPEPEAIEGARAHAIVTVLDLPDDPRARDSMVVQLTAAVLRASPAIAAMLSHGVVWHRADMFIETAASPPGLLPVLVCVDVTIAPEPDSRMSFLTHGLVRYGREEFFVTASRAGQGAVDFLLSLVGWMLDDPDKQLPTGDTVGRSATELVEIQRVPSPTGAGPEVVRLDLDLDLDL
jgi:hypothetical protein